MTASSPDDTAQRPVPRVRAAGGVVLAQDVALGRVVLVVHRPAHADWSLPKGHIDPGETAPVTALREVREETGVDARIVADLGTTEHPVGVPHATIKEVQWFAMRPTGPTDAREHDAVELVRVPDAEVDVVAWWPTDRALLELTYDGERELLDRALAADARGR